MNKLDKTPDMVSPSAHGVASLSSQDTLDQSLILPQPVFEQLPSVLCHMQSLVQAFPCAPLCSVRSLMMQQHTHRITICELDTYILATADAAT